VEGEWRVDWRASGGRVEFGVKGEWRARRGRVEGGVEGSGAVSACAQTGCEQGGRGRREEAGQTSSRSVTSSRSPPKRILISSMSS
jgi:hypothetical protein